MENFANGKKTRDANPDINRTNKSLKNLAEINYHVKRLHNEYVESQENEPKLESYYKPSDEMKEYQSVVFFLIGTTGGYLGYKVYKRF